MRKLLGMVVLSTVVACARPSDAATALGVCTGDATISSLAALSAFAARGCRVLNGKLDMSGNGPMLANVNLPSLTSISGDLTVYENRTLINIFLPVLTTVPGTVTVYGNYAPTRIQLPALTTVSGVLSVYGNPVLPTVLLPVLAT